MAALPKASSPEVGEDGSPTTSLIFKNGKTSVISSSSETLKQMGLAPYPRLHLNTQHALMITRALATLHAHSVGNVDDTINDCIVNGNHDVKDKYVYAKCPTSMASGQNECLMDKTEECNGECGDKLTSEITRLDITLSNLHILLDRMRGNNSYTNVVRQLSNLEVDVKTLVDFIQFSSAISKKWVASVGPISACDIWIKDSPDDDDMDDFIAIRLRGGTSLRAPPLRDAAWVWLTLIEPSALRDRYSELCEEYCTAFNAAHHRLTGEPGQPTEEILSYFDIMRDLGECFLHAFFTLLHKYVVSGTWYVDRELYKPEGLARVVAIIEFLIENGIIGNIFVA